jgi:hypothetical protein
VEEIMSRRRGGREEVFNMSLVTVMMSKNRVVPVSSTTRTRQHQLSIQ